MQNFTPESTKQGRRQHYFLLEVMLSITLIAICTTPLLYPYLIIQKSHDDYLKITHFERLANIELIHIKEQLYNGDITWKMIRDGEFSKKELKHFYLSISEKEKEKEKDHLEKKMTCLDISLTSKWQTPEKHTIHFTLAANISSNGDSQ